MVIKNSIRSKRHFLGVFYFVCLLITSSASAQELEPRAFWISPVGTNAVYFFYAHSRGDFLTDPTVPVEDVDARINSVASGYYRAVNFFGRSANFTVTVPYYWGTVQGQMENESQRVRRSGLADAQFRFSVNLLGAPAMTVPEFQEFRKDPKTILGASISIKPPTGQYASDRIINLGANRWSFKPQIGLIQPVRKRLLIELDAGVWLFTDNKDFMGQTRKQDPLLTGGFHLIYRIRPSLWVALDATYYWGGRTTVGGEQNADLQQNTRIGGTFAIPFGGKHLLKFSASSGFFISFGGDYDAFAISYQYGWITGQ